MSSYLHPDAEGRLLPSGQRGVFARAPIPADTLVALWGGDIVHVSALAALPDGRDAYYLHVEEEWLIGPGPGPIPDCELFNHSCDPTCGMRDQIGLVTRRPIAVDEELTFDYAMAELVGQPWECGCGAATCRGRVRDGDALRPELMTRYAGYFSPWIVRRQRAART